jgi:hypothetical protein
MFGIIAMGAAVTIYMFRRQIKQTERLANDRRQRRARAASPALSEIGEYATACIRGLYTLRPYFRPNGAFDREQALSQPMGWSSPRLPEDVFSVLSECIEVFDDEPAEMMAQMIRLLQVEHLCLATGCILPTS